MPEETLKRPVGRPKGIPGATKTTVRIFASVKRETAEKLERLARARGFKREPHSKKPFFGGAIDALAEMVETDEPEYLKLAKSISFATPQPQ